MIRTSRNILFTSLAFAIPISRNSLGGQSSRIAVGTRSIESSTILGLRAKRMPTERLLNFLRTSWSWRKISSDLSLFIATTQEHGGF